MPSSEIKELVQQDPLGLLTLLRDRMSREKGFLSFDPTQEGYVSPDGRSRLVVVKPKGQPFDSDFCQALFSRLSAVEGAARRDAQADDPDAVTVQIQAAGAYRVSLEAEQLIRHESIVNAIGSMVLLLGIVFAVFRTPWVMLYGFAPLALAAVLALGINGLIRGSLSPATSGSAGMLFGLGIDGVVLIYLRFLEERQTGATADDAVRRMSGTASSVVLAQATTAATFFALLFVDFPSLQDLGSLVGLGILLCCGFTILLLPALLPRGTAASPARGRAVTAPWLGRFRHAFRGPDRLAQRHRDDRPRGRVHTVTHRHERRQAAGAHLAAPRSKKKSRIDSLCRKTSCSCSTSTRTSNRSSKPMPASSGRLELQAPSVTTSGIGFLLPSAADQARVAEIIGASGTTSDDARRGIEAAGARAGFRPDTFVPFLAHVPRLLDPDERITYDGLMAHGLESVVSRFVVHKEGRYQAVTYLYPQQTTDPVNIDALRRIVHDVDPGLRVTGLPAINSDLRQQFFPQFLKGIGIGTVAVALLIYIVFRTLRHTLLALAPTAVGFIWSAGLLALLRVELDLFSLFAALTFIGISVDYGIYVLYRYVLEPSHGMGDVITTTGAAIIIACATALVGFGTLVNSSYGPLHVFGLVSIVTLTCCLTASVVSLPALILEMERWSLPAR